jgi:hypothetical protein
MIPTSPPKTRIIEALDIRLLLEDPLNPNVMTPAMLATFQRVMGVVGFLQPVLVRKARPEEITTQAFAAHEVLVAAGARQAHIHYEPFEDGPSGCVLPDFRGNDDGTPEKWCINCGVNLSLHDYYVTVDGHQRVKTARAEGLTHIPVVVIDVDQDTARLIQLEMNKLHGEVDLAAVARNMGFLVDVGGFSPDDLTLSAYEPGEIDALLSQAELDPNDAVMNGGAGGEEAPPSKPPKPFELTLTFATKAELARSKKGLRAAAGGGRRPDLAKGLLALLDAEDGSD